MGDGVWAAIAAVLGGVVGTAITALRQRSADRSVDWASYTDDLRAEIEGLRAEVATQRKRTDEQDEKIAALQKARQHDQDVITAALSHIGLLERGILAGSVPPIPPRPPILGGA